MRRPKRGKYQKKPGLKKYRKAPKMPKGGIKTEAQLKGYEDRQRTYKAACKTVDSENAKRMKVWTDGKKKIDSVYNAQLKKYSDFQKRVAKARA